MVLLAATIRCIIYCSFSFPLMSFCYCIVYLLLKSYFVERILKSKSNIIYFIVGMVAYSNKSKRRITNILCNMSCMHLIFGIHSIVRLDLDNHTNNLLLLTLLFFHS